MDTDTFVVDIVGHIYDMTRQAVASQVLLANDQQIDAVPFGLFANILGGFHIGGVDRSVHSEFVENGLRFVNQGLCVRARHELGQVGFTQGRNIIQFAVRKETGTPDTAQNVARFAFDAFLPIADGAFSFPDRFSFFDKQNAKVRIFSKIIGGKEPCRTAAHDDDIKRMFSVFSHSSNLSKIGHGVMHARCHHIISGTGYGRVPHRVPQDQNELSRQMPVVLHLQVAACPFSIIENACHKSKRPIRYGVEKSTALPSCQARSPRRQAPGRTLPPLLLVSVGRCHLLFLRFRGNITRGTSLAIIRKCTRQKKQLPDNIHIYFKSGRAPWPENLMKNSPLILRLVN
jgi:hypothetical protein